MRAGWLSGEIERNGFVCHRPIYSVEAPTNAAKTRLEMSRLNYNGSAGREPVWPFNFKITRTVDPESLVNEAWDLVEAEEYKDAYDKLERIPPVARRGVAYLTIREIVCQALNLIEERLAVAVQLVETDPTSEIDWVILGHSTLDVMGVRAAIRVWHRALRMDPDFDLVRWHAARHYCAVRRFQLAREHLKLSLQGDPGLIDAAWDEPLLAPIWETITEADQPSPEEGDEWKEQE
jgi:tetratricopeptide (TPR) repeat protein